jgi:hypothetical protein
MGSCECEGGGDCKNCKMPQFAALLVKASQYKNKDKILEGLGVKKVDEHTYVINV